MFMDIPAGGEGGYEPILPRCRSCKQPIPPGAPSETLTFSTGSDYRLEELSGPYHAACAQPFASLQRALDMLSRGWS
jgi:hypothetical protein